MGYYLGLETESEERLFCGKNTCDSESEFQSSGVTIGSTRSLEGKIIKENMTTDVLKCASMGDSNRSYKRLSWYDKYFFPCYLNCTGKYESHHSYRIINMKQKHLVMSRHIRKLTMRSCLFMALVLIIRLPIPGVNPRFAY